ncbi:recombinase family protein [Brevundimonas sp. S30B]|uniref:recombinase family protein n=1 Tax=unclassified Brevundimonas TaxID=2622653 RepID=UPI001072A3DF|nr:MULTISPECIES: recombinase family protein [unclassified Brevundimonas]QBX36880.1 recombinase family protein [Brevundimonas sp. MF30-B]TFW04325.1 recombinase family protein [Brevundimonas sp. S30B]
MPIKAFAYVRYSDPSQSTGNSVARQTEMAISYAATAGVELDWTYRDDGVSAFHGLNRTTGDLGRFIGDVQSGKVAKGSHLLIEGFDRFSREDPMEALWTFLTVIRSGIVLVTLADNQVWSAETLMGQSHRLFGVLPHMERAHSESKVKSTRTLHNWQQRRAKGVVVDRLTKPAWLDVVDGEYKVNDDKQRILLRIFEEVAAGTGVDRVARRLNEAGERAWGHAYKDTGSRAGQTRKWHGSYIQTILNSRAIIGEHQHHQYESGSRKRIPIGDPIPGYFPPAISLDLYHRAKAAFKSRNVGGGRKEASLVNLFGDAIRCADCGSRMRWGGHHHRERDGGNFAYYRCSSTVQRTGCDHTPKHRVVYLENAVLNLVTEIRLEGLADDAEAKAKVAEAKHQRQLAKDRAMKAARLVLEMDNAIMRELANEASDASLAANKAVLDAEEELAIVRTRLMPSNQQTAIADLRAAYTETKDIGLRMQLAGAVKTVMDNIIIDRDGFATVSVMGGARVYRFKIAKTVTSFTLVSGETVMEIGQARTNAEAQAFKDSLKRAA